MDDGKLKNALISRVMQFGAAEPVGSILEAHISRRQFLIGTSAASTLSFIGNLGLHDVPSVYRVGRKVIVAYEAATWEVDPSLFGPLAKVGFRRHNSGFLILLRNATLAGTNLACDFLATLAKSTGGWEVTLLLSKIGFSGKAPLGHWIRRATTVDGVASIRGIQLGGIKGEFPKSVPLAISAGFNFVFGQKGSTLAISDPVACICERLVLCPQPYSKDSLHATLGEENPAPLTHFSIEEARNITIKTLGSSSTGRCFTFEPENLLSYHGEACGATPDHSSVVFLEANGTFGVDGFGLNPREFQRIQIKRAALMFSTGPRDAHAAIAGKISQSKHSLDFGHWVATLSGTDEKPFYARFRGGRAERLSLSGKLHQLTIPVADAESATLTFPGQPLEINFLTSPDTFTGNRCRISAAQQTNELGSSLFIIGLEPMASVSLDKATINIRRGVDLFNLSYKFTGFDLRVRRGLSTLRRRRPPKRNHDWPDATVAVYFPPQHIAEEWFEVQNPSAAMPNPPKFPTTVRARLSGPSRIVFSVPGSFKNPKWTERPLTIECLTEWGDLALTVSDRAAEADLSSATLLSLSGIGIHDNLKQAIEKVAATLKPPKPNETALEMTGRLLLSPAKNAGWITPVEQVNPSRALLWNARLDDVGRQTVRAIWSRMMVPGSLADACNPLDPNSETGHEHPKHLLVLTGDDHRQIVTLTSVYGLIALRRLPTTDSETKSTDKALEKLPKSGVIRPSPDYDSLKEADALKTYTHQDLGFALPTPFTDANMILTSIGGTLDAEWHGEPLNIPFYEEAKQKYPDVNWPRSFSLERFGYRTQLGRDIRIDVEKKGYLIPIGHRATHVKLTERRFFKHPEYGYPVAYLVQRTFIVVKSPDKSFPAVYQPFDSRDFPADRVVMLTKSTPDLVPLPEDADLKSIYSGPPVEELTGRVRVEGLQNSVLVLWPRLSPGAIGSAGDFKFKWTVDNDEVPFVSTLLFVENAALGSEKVMKGICDYYRSRDPVIRTAKASGTRRRYAQSEKNGDTSFNTDLWILSTRGRLLPAETKGSEQQPSETEAFMMDGRMEGADQPPLYPFVERGRITIQSLDRLVGSPQGLIDVSFNEAYRRTGFNTSENKSEIYLNVLGPDIKLDVTGNGDSTGGLAKPNTLVAALSRKIGIVGGRKKPSSLPQDTGALAKATGSIIASVYASSSPPPQATESPYDFPNAQNGKFDPKEFLGGIANTKLLGLIDLKEILSAIDIDGAPQLLEKIGYGAAGATETVALQNIKEIAKQLLPAARESLCSFSTLVGTPLPEGSQCKSSTNGESALPKALAFRDLYPVLDQRLQTFAKTLMAAAPAIEKAAKITAIAEPVTAMATDGGALLAELERTLRDPVPRVIETDIESLSMAWDELRNLINRNYFEIARKLRNEVIGKSISTFCNEVGQSNLGGVLFGTSKDVTCEMIVDNPAAALSSIENSLFSQVFAGQLADLLSYLRSYEAEVTGRITWNQGSISPSIFLLVKLNAEALSDRLQDEGDNVLETIGQAKLADAIAMAIVNVVTNAASNFPTSDNPDAVRQILEATDLASNDLTSQIGSIIDQHPELFKPVPSFQLQSVVQAFKKKAVPAMADAVRSIVKTKTDQVRQLLLTRLQETRGKAIQRLLGAFQRIVASMAKTAIFVKVAQGGRSLSHWCDSDYKVVEFADDFSGGLLGATMATDLLKIAQNTQDAALPPFAPSDLLERFAKVKRSILVDTQLLASTVKSIYDSADKLHAVRTQVNNRQILDVCANVGQFLNPVASLLQLRREAVSRITDLAAHAASLESLISDVNVVIRDNQSHKSHTVLESEIGPLDAATKAISGLLGEIVRLTSSILGGVSSIGQAGLTKTWSAIEAQVALVRSSKQLGKVPNYLQSLDVEMNDLLNAAKDLQSKLNDPQISASQLQVLGNQVSVFSLEHDKRFAALVLQSVVLDNRLSLSLGKQIANALSTTATIFLTLHQLCSDLLGKLLSLLGNDPIVSQVINPGVLLNFESVKKEVDLDLASLKAIKDAGDDPSRTLDAGLKLLNDRWKITDIQSPPTYPPALVRAIDALSDLMDHILRGDLSSLVRLPNIKNALESIKEQVLHLTSQLLPTRVDLSYTWKTGLADFPAGENAIFKLAAPKSPDDLVIDAKVSVDFISGARSAVIAGTIKPFGIKLIGKALDIVTINFKGASFNSRNGSAPEFNADIQEVILGTILEFLKPLQAWMSPSSDNGPYVKPIILGGSAGIEAGYIYDAGLIQLGSLQFINVAFGVAARLPFGNQPAELAFSFASPERPFLISQPPYGGGGYLRLVSNSQDITDFSMSLVFGAVVSIKFGPLNAHGHVTAGIFIQTGASGHVIRAFVQAVGEGNIACFSICVSIQVGLQDDTGSGTLTGYSIYSISFKVGFLSLSFSFRASYTIKGGNGSSSNSGTLQSQLTPRPLDQFAREPAYETRDQHLQYAKYVVGSRLIESAQGRAGAPEPEKPYCETVDTCRPLFKGAPRIFNKVPRRATQWCKYQKRISLDLLKE